MIFISVLYKNYMPKIKDAFKREDDEKDFNKQIELFYKFTKNEDGTKSITGLTELSEILDICEIMGADLEFVYKVIKGEIDSDFVKMLGARIDIMDVVELSFCKNCEDQKKKRKNKKDKNNNTVVEFKKNKE